MKKILLFQLLVTVIFPCMAVAAYRVVETARITSKSQALQVYQRANQQVLTKVQILDSDLNYSAKQQARRHHVIHIINQKNKLPVILGILTSQKRTGRINQLVLDHQYLKINYSTADIDDTLAFFQVLNSYPSFCDVSLDPLGSYTMAKDSTQNDISNYELNAKLCDDSAN